MSSSAAQHGSVAQIEAIVSESTLLDAHAKRPADEPQRHIASNGYYATNQSNLTGLSDSIAASDDYDSGSDEDDNGGWHVAVVPVGRSSSSSSTQPSSLRTFLSLVSVAFSAIKQNIVSRNTAPARTTTQHEPGNQPVSIRNSHRSRC